MPERIFKPGGEMINDDETERLKSYEALSAVNDEDLLPEASSPNRSRMSGIEKDPEDDGLSLAA